MAIDKFTLEESRKLAVLIARSWADPALAEQYRVAPEAVLAGSGIDLHGREAPELPARPADLPTENLPSPASFSSASSLSTVTCPCTGCTASCAGAAPEVLASDQVTAMMKLADDPKGRENARQLTAAWGIDLAVHP
jgi:hypothetical protein